ncbi:MAG: MATE family efflux transporter [Brevinematia bacterium]
MKDLTKGNPIKTLFIFALPIILSDLIQGIQSLIDLFYVGRLVGTSGIAVISIVMPIIFLLLAILIGIGISSNILIAQAFGANDKEKLSKVIRNSFSVTLILSSLLTIIGILLSPIILHLLSIPQNIFTSTLIFLNITILSLPLTALENWLMGITRGLGNSKFSLYFAITLLILKFILTPIFIKGFWIIPEMGAIGAAVSNIFMAIILLIAFGFYLIKKYEIIRKNIKLEFEKEIFFKFIGIGLPASLQMIIISLSVTVLMGFISRFGEKTIALFGIGNRIDQFAFLPAMSLGNSMTTLSSQNLSANRQDRVKEFLKWSQIISLILSVIVVIFVNLFAKDIFNFFVKDEELALMGIDYFRIMSIAYIIMGLNFSIQGIIRGAGDTIAIMILKLISMILLRIPIAYLLAFVILKSPNGIWASFPILVFFELIVSYTYYKSELWRGKIVFKKKTEEIEAQIVEKPDLA